jgi:hypothetical protein
MKTKETEGHVVTRHFRRGGLAALAGLIAAVAIPTTVSHAAPTVLHYNIQQTSFCGSTPSCYPGGNVNLFPAGADDSVVQLGFPWPVYVYGKSYTKAWVSSNGNVQFGVTSGTAQTTYTNDPLPTSALSAKAGVAPYWDDLLFNASASPIQGVFYRSVTFKGQPAFVISWRGTEFSTGNPVRGEVIFYQHSKTITFQYLQGTAESATIGVQKAPIGPEAEWSYNSPVIFTDEELNFVAVG